MNARLSQWIVVNALGLAVGFVALLQVHMLFQFGTHWELHWKWNEKAFDQNVLSYVMTLVAGLTGGLVFGSCQALALRPQWTRTSSWILATVAGFGACVVLIDWPLIALGLLGDIPGPVEPLIVTVGATGLAGVAQYLVMRRRGTNASKWLLLWIVGLVAGIVPTAILFMSIEGSGVSLSYLAEVFLSGLTVAGTAALVSGNALFAALR